jgi:hypothetical protein
MTEGLSEESRRLLDDGNKMLPSNTLVRNRYMVSLQPRWGGSYGEMREFINRSKSDGASREGLLQLEAIMYSDMGHSLMEQDEPDEAVKHFARALDLSTKVRTEFRSEFLWGANYYSCRFPELKKYC